MERLTYKKGNHYYTKDPWIVEIRSISDNSHLEVLTNCLDKLGAYEDAEEQGLLLKLPCKIGDTAWVIDEDGEYPGKKKIYEAKWKRVNFVQTSANHTFELRGEVGYQIYDWFSNDGRTMPYGMYVGQTHTKVGEVVFLTKEEAEQALAKMKGGTRNV